MKSVLRTYWRQLLILILMILPFLTFTAFGLIWLINSGWLVYVMLGMVIPGIAILMLSISIRRTASPVDRNVIDPEIEWAPEEERVWTKVQEIALSAQRQPPQDFEGLRVLAQKVAHSAANELHGNGDFVWAKFTIPEILCAIERAAHNLRRSVRKNVPGSESISVADALSVYDFYDKNRTLGVLAFYAYRAFRVYSNPLSAAVQEANGLLHGQALSTTSTAVQGWAARLFVEEVGRSAINLYAGRYRLSDSEVRQKVVDGAPLESGPIPIRVLLAGQVNAGKSSLTNALLGSVKSPVSELPTPGGVREYRVNSKESLDLVILDCSGLMSPNDIHLKTILEHCDKVDLIIWVAKANNPARDLDAAALCEIRKQINSNSNVRPPSLMLVMTHIDKVSPTKEWSPPYDLNQSDNIKAYNMRSALTHVADALGFTGDPQIPIALCPDEPAYNLDAVWSAIGGCLSKAQLTALDRELKQSAVFSLSQTLAQCREGGRFILGKVLVDWR